jgi:hypothetical protein
LYKNLQKLLVVVLTTFQLVLDSSLSLFLIETQSVHKLGYPGSTTGDYWMCDVEVTIDGDRVIDRWLSGDRQVHRSVIVGATRRACGLCQFTSRTQMFITF